MASYSRLCDNERRVRDARKCSEDAFGIGRPISSRRRPWRPAQRLAINRKRK